jgi:hypothetical protein
MGPTDDCKVVPEMQSEDQASDNDPESNYLTPTSKRTLAEHSFRPENPESNHEAIRGFAPCLILRPGSSKEDIAKGFQFAKPLTLSSENKEKPRMAPAHPTTNREFQHDIQHTKLMNLTQSSTSQKQSVFYRNGQPLC